MHRLKIAQVCPKYYPSIGGIETHVKELSERLVKGCFDVDVLCTDPEGNLPHEEVINGVRVLRFKSWAPGEAFWFSRGLNSYLAKNSSSYDIIHAHSFHGFPSLYAAKQKCKNKLVYTPHYHGVGHTLFRNLLHIPYRHFAAETFQKADLIIFVSKYEKDLAKKRFNFDEKKIIIIPNGLNLNEFLSLRKKRQGFILYVGRLEKYKGIDILIKTLPKLDVNIRLEVVGRGPYKKGLLDLTRSLNLQKRVIFSQDLPRNELLDKYATAGVFAMLSDHEAFGITVAEAIAARTPCILVNESALKEWVDNRNCYGIDPPVDSDKLATLIPKVIGLKVSSEAYSDKLLDWNNFAKQLSELYTSIADNLL